MEEPIICRACLNEITIQYISLDTPLYDGTVLDVFNYCTKLNASLQDDFPTNICIPCGTSLQTAYDFIKTAYETDQFLRGNIGSELEKEEKHEDDGEVVIEVIKKIECDSDKEYLEEYIEENVEDNDNIEIKEEDEEFKLNVPLPKEEINIELMDEDQPSSYFQSITKYEIPDENTVSQELEIINEVDNDCSRSEHSDIHDGFIEEIEDTHSKETKEAETVKKQKNNKGLELRNKLRMERRNLRDATNPFDMPEERFRERYRFSRDAAQILLEELKPHMKKGQMKTFIPIPLRFCAALNFFASGSYRKDVSQNVFEPMSRAMVSRVVAEVSEILQNHFANKWIKFPSEDEYDDIKKRFFEATGFPGVIGAVDCTQVKIQKPSKEVRSCYRNRKGDHTKKVQLICDFDLKILGVYARFGGASQDAFIWEGSTIKELLEQRFTSREAEKHNSWLLGDSAYPLSPWLMTPYRRATGVDERTFNIVHEQARKCVERLSRVLNSVFGCLKPGLFYSPQAAGRIINACCVLHNFRLKHKIHADVDDVQIDETDNDGEKIFVHPESNTVEQHVALRIRDSLKAKIKHKDICIDLD